MIGIDATLVELKSQRAQLEIQLLAMQRRLNDTSGERARELRAQMERTETDLAQVGRRVIRIESGDLDASDAGEIADALLQTGAELDHVRSQILAGLRALAEPLRQHAELAERQRRLSGRMRAATGKDTSYQAYIDTALLRSGDIDATVGLVLEAIRKARPVA